MSKKVINGKIYNTETSTKIAGWWNGCSTNDFNYCSEDLYRTRKGNFFLDGEGGARSKYAHSCGQNSWCGGSDIIPLTIEEAKEWVELHANEKYEELFSTEEA